MSRYGRLAGKDKPQEDGKQSELQPSNQATKQPVEQPSNDLVHLSPHVDSVIDVVRRSIKSKATETTSYRLSEMEKKRITVAAFELKMDNMQTNENEIMRIALNLLLEDYKDKGEDSHLKQVLKAKLDA